MCQILKKIDNNHIKFNVDINNNTKLGQRDLTIVVNWTTYKLFNWVWIEKNWWNIVNWNWVFPDLNSKQVKIDFDTEISSWWNLTINKIYGTWDNIPSILYSNFNWKSLVVNLTWVIAWDSYDLSLSGFIFSGWKIWDNYKKNMI